MGDSKLLNHTSDFQRNSTFRLRCFNGNSAIDGNHKWAWIVGNNMPITLTFVALSSETNFEKVLFSVLTFTVIRFLTSLTVGITQETLLFEFWLEEFMIRSRLSILA